MKLLPIASITELEYHLRQVGKTSCSDHNSSSIYFAINAVTSLTENTVLKPRSLSGLSGSQPPRYAVLHRRASICHPPPLSTRLVPCRGPVGLAAPGRRFQYSLEPNQSSHHSHTLPAISRQPYGDAPSG